MLSLDINIIGLVVALFSIHGVHSDEYTCCYGKTCPLPVFYQYVGDYRYFIDDVSVIDEDACCPSSSLFSSGIDYVTPQGTIETACVCEHSQDCDGDNLAYSVGYTCDGGCMTDSGCPDANVDDINLNQGGCMDASSGNLCTYSPGGGANTRGMTQRCNLPTTVCVADTDTGVFAGTYQAAGSFFNGFPWYYNDEYYLAVVALQGIGIEGTTWVFANFSGTVLSVFFIGNLEDFSDITSWESGISYSIFVYEGSCQEPTPYPTTPSPTTPTPYYTPHPTKRPSGGSSSSSSAGSSDVSPVIWIIIGVLILIGIGVVAFYMWRHRQKQQIESHYVNMSTKL